jgi:LmbE family N-acetylglucosaminyl deacetylase
VKVLALGAHPDDIEIFMFGTMAAYAAQGAELTFAIATDGARGGHGDPASLARARRKEATAAAGLVGVTPHFLDFPDGALVADAALIGALKALVDRRR